MGKAGFVIEQFRAATSVAHHALDGAFDPVEAFQPGRRRIAMLQRYHAMHRGAESAMAPFLGGIAALQFDRRRRAGMLGEALAGMGARPALEFAPVPCIGSRAAAFGLLYVMEGSTLGGHIILKRLLASGADAGGLAFLDPYSADTGAMWRIVTDLLEVELAAPADLAEAVEAARMGFGYAAACLGAARAAVVA